MGTGALGLGIATGTGLPVGAEAAGPAELARGAPALPPVTLVSIRHTGPGGADTLGVKLDDGVLDVALAAGLVAHPGSLPLTLEQLLREGSWPLLAEVIAAARSPQVKQAAMVPESSITYGKLFANPGKIVCVGLNYRRHAAELNVALPKLPVLFNKFNNSLAPHNGAIRLPAREIAYKFDYETELLVVMGRHARDVSESAALDYVAGYCTSNDFSARDLQFEVAGGQWMIGKTLDGFAPIGPYFVSATEVGDPNKLKLETRVNGEVRQSSNTSDMVFNVPQLIAYISRHFPLEPGDIIFTGTPEGVIFGKPPDQRVWLKAGDHVTSTIEKLGTLNFTLA